MKLHNILEHCIIQIFQERRYTFRWNNGVRQPVPLTDRPWKKTVPKVIVVGFRSRNVHATPVPYVSPVFISMYSDLSILTCGWRVETLIMSQDTKNSTQNDGATKTQGLYSRPKKNWQHKLYLRRDMLALVSLTWLFLVVIASLPRKHRSDALSWRRQDLFTRMLQWFHSDK